MEIHWHLLGPIVLCSKGWPSFPTIPKLPGIYRLKLNDGRCYIGAAGDLRRRLYEYRRPTKGNEGEHYIHSLLVTAGGGTIEVYTDGDLVNPDIRFDLEQLAIRTESACGTRLINGRADADRLRAKIRFLERELACARTALASLEETSLIE